MLADVLASKLRNSFRSVWNIWIPESQRFRQYASVLSFNNINIFVNNTETEITVPSCSAEQGQIIPIIMNYTSIQKLIRCS